MTYAAPPPSIGPLCRTEATRAPASRWGGSRLNIDLSSLLTIAVIAVAAPLISELPVGLRLPIVVVEIILGFVVGPYGLGIASSTGVLGFLGLLGLTFLFFLAGFDIDFDEIRGRPITALCFTTTALGTLSWSGT